MLHVVSSIPSFYKIFYSRKIPKIDRQFLWNMLVVKDFLEFSVKVSVPCVFLSFRCPYDNVFLLPSSFSTSSKWHISTVRGLTFFNLLPLRLSYNSGNSPNSVFPHLNCYSNPILLDPGSHWLTGTDSFTKMTDNFRLWKWLLFSHPSIIKYILERSTPQQTCPHETNSYSSKILHKKFKMRVSNSRPSKNIQVLSIPYDLPDSSISPNCPQENPVVDYFFSFLELRSLRSLLKIQH